MFVLLKEISKSANRLSLSENPPILPYSIHFFFSNFRSAGNLILYTRNSMLEYLIIIFVVGVQATVIHVSK